MPPRRPADAAGPGDDAPPWTQAVQDAYNRGERDPGALWQIAVAAGVSREQADQTVNLITSPTGSVGGGDNLGAANTLGGGESVYAPPNSANASDSAPLGGDTIGDTGIPRVFMEQVAEAVTRQDEAGNFPDPMAVIGTMAAERGLTPEQVDEAESLLGPYTDAIHTATANGPIQGPSISEPPPGARTRGPLDANTLAAMGGALPTAADVMASFDDPDQFRADIAEQQQAADITREHNQASNAAAQDAEDKADEAAGRLLATAMAQGHPIVYGDLALALQDYLPDGISPADATRWIDARIDAATATVQQQENQQAQAEGRTATDVESQAILGANDNVPSWMLVAAQQAGQVNRNGLTREAKARFVDYYNTLYNTDYTVSEFATVASTVLKDPTSENQDIWHSALVGEEPSRGFSVELPGNKGKLDLSQEDVGILQGTYGLSDAGIVRLTRLGNIGRGLRQDGGARDPDLFVLAAIAKANGWTDTLADQQHRESEISQIERKLQAMPTGRGHEGPEDVSIRAGLEKRLTELKMLNSPTSGAGAQTQHGGLFGARQAADAALDKYRQNETLAVLEVFDPGLTARLVRTGGDPTKMDPTDVADAFDILQRSGVAPRDKRTGFRDNAALAGALHDYFDFGGGAGGGGGGGGGGTVRRLIDPVQIKSKVNELWQGVLRGGDAPNELVTAFTKSLQGELDKTPQGQDFDISARIQQWLKSRPEYNTLYGHKPTDMTDQEYQGQFVNAEQSMLGADISSGGSLDHVAAGIRDNKYQTTVGGSFFAGLGGGDNSTLQERMARIANIVAANT